MKNLVFVFFSLSIYLFTGPLAFAGENVVGYDCYTYGDNETRIQGKEIARKMALRKAIEASGVYIKAKSEVKNSSLTDDMIQTIAAGYLKITKDVGNEGNNKICHTIEAVIESNSNSIASINSLLRSEGNKHKQSGDLIIKDGKDILIHKKVVEAISNYIPGQPVYVAYGEPLQCGGPRGNSWMTDPAANVNQYRLEEEGDYLRARKMVNIQFQIVQLKDNKPGLANIEWAALDQIYAELGDCFFQGKDCRGKGRTAIWVRE